MRQELLIKYALYSAQPNQERMSVATLGRDEDLAEVETHLATCPSCNLRVKAYRQLYLANQPLSPQLTTNGQALPECIDETSLINSKKRRTGKERSSEYHRFAAIALILIGAAGLSVFLADHFTRPKYYALASVRSDRYDQIILYRERSSLLQALFLFRSGNYERAIPAIEASITTKDGYNMRPYLRLMQGLAYLKLAETNSYGFFPRFDLNRVEAAIVTFQACIDEATTPEMIGVRASAHIYQAKAYLVIGHAELAQQALQGAINTGDELSAQARQLLQLLEENIPKS